MNDDLITHFSPPRTSVFLCASVLSYFSLDPNALAEQFLETCVEIHASLKSVKNHLFLDVSGMQGWSVEPGWLAAAPKKP